MLQEKEDRSLPMKVKYWTFAGILLTEYCPSSCESCYLNLSGSNSACMDMQTAVRVWRELQAASPHGCRIHLTGGEAFSNWPLLIEVAEMAYKQGLGPLDKVETNGYWADNEDVVRERLSALDRAGMRTLAVSADPFHQEFVPIDRVRFLVSMAKELLGADRVQVRWEHWVERGTDISNLDRSGKNKMFSEWIALGYDRLNGRAADKLASLLEKSPRDTFAGNCTQALLRNRHVHVMPTGEVSPGVCAGISIGRVDEGLTMGEIREKLIEDHSERPVVGRLVSGGPRALLELAEQHGFIPEEGYAGKCHMCWKIRRHLASTGHFQNELSPGSIYTPPN